MSKLFYGRPESVNTKFEQGVWRCLVKLQGHSYSFVRSGSRVTCTSEPRIESGIYRNNLKHDAFVVAAAELHKFIAQEKQMELIPSHVPLAQH